MKVYTVNVGWGGLALVGLISLLKYEIIIVGLTASTHLDDGGAGCSLTLTVDSLTLSAQLTCHLPAVLIAKFYCQLGHCPTSLPAEYQCFSFSPRTL